MLIITKHHRGSVIEQLKDNPSSTSGKRNSRANLATKKTIVHSAGKITLNQRGNDVISDDTRR